MLEVKSDTQIRKSLMFFVYQWHVMSLLRSSHLANVGTSVHSERFCVALRTGNIQNNTICSIVNGKDNGMIKMKNNDFTRELSVLY